MRLRYLPLLTSKLYRILVSSLVCAILAEKYSTFPAFENSPTRNRAYYREPSVPTTRSTSIAKLEAQNGEMVS